MPTSEIKRTYEAMFLVDSAKATSHWDGVLSEINTLFERAEAEVIGVHKWDENRLCYEIRGCKRGTYILSFFRALPGAIKGLERDVQINEWILRVLILRADHVSPEEMKSPRPAVRAMYPDDGGRKPAPAPIKARDTALDVAPSGVTQELSDDLDVREAESPEAIPEEAFDDNGTEPDAEPREK